MTRRQSNNEWIGCIAAHPAPPQKIPSAKICWKSSRLDFFWDQDGILLNDYLPKGRNIKAEYYSSLLVQLKDILKEKRQPREGHHGGLLLAPQFPSSPGTCNPEGTGLPEITMS